MDSLKHRSKIGSQEDQYHSHLRLIVISSCCTNKVAMATVNTQFYHLMYVDNSVEPIMPLPSLDLERLLVVLSIGSSRTRGAQTGEMMVFSTSKWIQMTPKWEQK